MSQASVPKKEGRDVTAVLYDSAKFYPDNSSVEDVGDEMRQLFLPGSPKKVG